MHNQAQPLDMSILQGILQHTSDGILVIDRQGTILYVNPVCESIHGWEAQEAVGRDVHIFFEASDLLDQLLTRSDALRLRCVGRRKQGLTVSLELRIVPVKGADGNLSSMIILEKEVEMTDLYQQMVEFTSDSVLICIDYQIVYANAAAATLLGEDVSEELIDRYIFHYLDSQSHQLFVHKINSLEASTKPSSPERLRLVRKDDTSMEVEIRAFHTTYKGRSAIKLWCRDITHLASTERSLRETESMYKRLVENAPIGVYLYQGEKITYVNQHLAHMFGYTVDEFMDLDHREMVSSEEWGQVMDISAMLQNNKTTHPFSIKGLHRDQRTLYIEGTITFITYSGRPAFFVTCQDITGKRESERIILENARSYQRLVRFLPEAIVVSQNGRCIYANKSAEQIIAVSDEKEMIGSSIFDLLHPDHHESTRETLEVLSASDESTGFRERKIVRMDGVVIDVEISSIRIHDFYGEYVILSVIRDLTERKKREESLILSEKLSIVGKLAAGVAHEIRNPLAAIRGFCQLLSEKNKDLQGYYKIMMAELDRINLIVNEFMTLAKPQVVHYDQRDVNEIIRNVVVIMESQSLLHNVSFLLELDTTLPVIPCEENQLKQVFINVINNAFDAMPKGGRLTIVTERAGESEVLISIRDQGEGIPAEFLERIGDPFFTTKEHGTGLGLMVSRQIIENHGGRLEIRSEKNRGTEIRICLPAGQAIMHQIRRRT